MHFIVSEGIPRSVLRSGCMDRKKTETGPDRNRLQPDRWLRLPAFKMKRPPKDRSQWTGCNRLQPVLGTP